ncbi:hypothetical protein V8C86DRAFT_2930637 [Haematococcus lacustris]
MKHRRRMELLLGGSLDLSTRPEVTHSMSQAGIKSLQDGRLDDDCSDSDQHTALRVPSRGSCASAATKAQHLLSLHAGRHERSSICQHQSGSAKLQAPQASDRAASSDPCRPCLPITRQDSAAPDPNPNQAVHRAPAPGPSLVIQNVLWPLPSCPETADLLAASPCPRGHRHYINSHGQLVVDSVSAPRSSLNQALLHLTGLHQLPPAQQPILSLAPPGAPPARPSCTPCWPTYLHATSTQAACSSTSTTRGTGFFTSPAAGTGSQGWPHGAGALPHLNPALAQVTLLTASAAAMASAAGAAFLDCELFGSQLQAGQAAAVAAAAAGVRACGRAADLARVAPLTMEEQQVLVEAVRGQVHAGSFLAAGKELCKRMVAKLRVKVKAWMC